MYVQTPNTLSAYCITLQKLPFLSPTIPFRLCRAVLFTITATVAGSTLLITVIPLFVVVFHSAQKHGTSNLLRSVIVRHFLAYRFPSWHLFSCHLQLSQHWAADHVVFLERFSIIILFQTDLFLRSGERLKLQHPPSHSLPCSLRSAPETALKACLIAHSTFACFSFLSLHK